MKVNGMASEDIATRFWSKVKKTDACWLWVGDQCKGYGRLSVRGRVVQATHIAWELLRGSVPAGMCLLHNCPGGDRPACVNPEHLFLGTQKDNNLDKAAKGRASRLFGTRNAAAKLTASEARQIRERYAAGGATMREIGQEFGVARRTVADIVHRKTWAHA